MSFISSIITFTLITCITVSGLYILTGLTGMFSLGQAAFMAVGAYAGGLLELRLHVPFFLCLIAAMAAAVLLGFLIGFPIMRLRRDYLALVTLGFGEAIIATINQSVGITGGINSLTGSIFATFILTALPEVLRSVSQYRMLVYSALVLLIINFKPDGLFGHWELTDLWKKKPGKSEEEEELHG